jgi:hypothetical protein
MMAAKMRFTASPAFRKCSYVAAGSRSASPAKQTKHVRGVRPQQLLCCNVAARHPVTQRPRLVTRQGDHSLVNHKTANNTASPNISATKNGPGSGHLTQILQACRLARFK